MFFIFLLQVLLVYRVVSEICLVLIVGMNKESEAFAVELFDALSRKREIQSDSITKVQLKDFWEQISDQSFDSRLRTFFDM